MAATRRVPPWEEAKAGAAGVALKSDLTSASPHATVAKAACRARRAPITRCGGNGISHRAPVVSIDDSSRSRAAKILPTAKPPRLGPHVRRRSRGLRRRAQAARARRRCSRTRAAALPGRAGGEGWRSRSPRFGGSVYLLEPEREERRGAAWRDFSTFARWATKARFGVGEPESW